MTVANDRMEDDSGPGLNDTGGDCWSLSRLMWWTTLLTAVIAVPLFGFAISYLSPFRGMGLLPVFVLASWLCTYIGMRLMENPRMWEPIRSRSKKE